MGLISGGIADRLPHLTFKCTLPYYHYTVKLRSHTDSTMYISIYPISRNMSMSYVYVNYSEQCKGEYVIQYLLWSDF